MSGPSASYMIFQWRFYKKSDYVTLNGELYGLVPFQWKYKSLFTKVLRSQ